MSSQNPRSRSGDNPYRTISASERRARRRARAGKPEDTPRAASERAASAAVVPQDLVNDMLRNPTKVVTEDQLRSEYSYVLADIRGMFLLAAGLVVLLIALATLLPR